MPRRQLPVRRQLPACQPSKPIEVPWPVQVFTHNHGQCCTNWAAPHCTCGQYALHWVTKAVAWSETRGALELMPDNSEILEILAAHVEGPYRFVHEARTPYVQVGPANSGQSITIQAGPRLSLRDQARSRRVEGPLTFAVIFKGSGIQLVELAGSPSRASKRQKPVVREPDMPPLQAELVPEGGSVRAPAPTPASKPVKVTQLVVAPEPESPVSPKDLTVPARLQPLCVEQDVHPELGDYLVMPMDLYPDLPHRDWIVRSPRVQEVHMHKPRLER